MINNEFYHELKEKWYEDMHHPVALLRAENKVRVPWVVNEIRKKFPGKISLLDVGCGAGFLTNEVSKEGHFVTGVDLSEESLKVAQKYDETKKVQYLKANGYQLPFEDDSFDVVTAMDVLEHVEEPSKLISEASRVLKKGGLFFFHTFNRNLLSYFVVIKGVDWFIPNAPKNMHVYPLFIKPKELKELLVQHGLSSVQLLGFEPKLFSFSFIKMLISRKIPEHFTFKFSNRTWIGYSGFAEKRSSYGKNHI